MSCRNSSPPPSIPYPLSPIPSSLSPIPSKTPTQPHPADPQQAQISVYAFSTTKARKEMTTLQRMPQAARHSAQLAVKHPTIRLSSRPSPPKSRHRQLQSLAPLPTTRRDAEMDLVREDHTAEVASPSRCATAVSARVLSIASRAALHHRPRRFGYHSRFYRPDVLPLPRPSPKPRCPMTTGPPASPPISPHSSASSRASKAPRPDLPKTSPYTPGQVKDTY